MEEEIRSRLRRKQLTSVWLDGDFDYIPFFDSIDSNTQSVK